MVDGQLIIMNDLLGFYPTFRPWFAKCYVPDIITQYTDSIKVDNLKKYGIDTRQDGVGHIVYLAIRKYVEEVKAKTFPSPDYIYPIKPDELISVKSSSLWKLTGEEVQVPFHDSKYTLN